jgi:hypothetical protein
MRNTDNYLQMTIDEYKKYRKGNEIASRRLRRVITLSRMFHL